MHVHTYVCNDMYTRTYVCTCHCIRQCVRNNNYVHRLVTEDTSVYEHISGLYIIRTYVNLHMYDAV